MSSWKLPFGPAAVFGTGDATHRPHGVPSRREPAVIEALGSVDFKSASYMGQQDGDVANEQLIRYFRWMFGKIPLWDPNAEVVVPRGGSAGTANASQAGHAVPVGEGPLAVKPEAEDDAQPHGVGDTVGHPPLGPAYHALGILTQLNDPAAIGDELQLPWEFYPIQDPDDDDSYTEALQALAASSIGSRASQAASGLSFFGSVIAGATPGTVRPREDASRVAPSEAVHSHSTRISLYARLVPRFTGLYPSIPVRVVGEPLKRSSSGALTAVLLRHILLPSRPRLPWVVASPPESPAVGGSRSTRLHFCCGPLPRRNGLELVVQVTRHALLRKADALIIGGPLVPGYRDFEKNMMKVESATFDEQLGILVDAIEAELHEHYTHRPIPAGEARMKVILVSHRDDMTQIPVLPTTMYPVQGSGDVWMQSNPCRIIVNGIHIGVCNDDIVGDMRERFVERWPSAKGSLRRVVEAIVRSRVYTPCYEIPMSRVDVKYLSQLRIDVQPPGRERHTVTPGTSGGVKTEDEVESGGLPLEGAEEAEHLPHILLLPSKRPQFAFVTRVDGEEMVEEPTGDQVDGDGSGVLVVNQGLHFPGATAAFQLTVVEIAIPDSDAVVRRGASFKNGIVCSMLPITRSE